MIDKSLHDTASSLPNATPERNKTKPRKVRGSQNIVNNARYDLSHSDNIPIEFEYDLLRIYAQNMLLAALISPFFMLVVALAMMNWVNSALVAIWFVFSLATNGVLIFSAQQFLKRNYAQVIIPKWKLNFLIQEFIHSSSWALLSLLAIQSASELATMFIALVLFVHISFRMVFSNSWVLLFYAGTVPAFLGIISSLLMLQDGFYAGMACMITGLFLFVVFMMRGQHNIIVNMLSYRVEKNNLIVELEEANRILETAKFRAEQASLAKTRFLANMSHELRTPLNAILGFSEVMKEEILGEHTVESYKEYSTDIFNSGEHLLNLIEEILDLSRIETGNYQLEPQDVCLCALGQESYKLLKLRADKKGVLLSVECKGKFLNISSDKRALKQIYLNLLSNAIKFTPKGGHVGLSIEVLPDGRQSLAVRDNGPGIPKKEMSLVLTPFGQGTEALNSLEGGAGLGLPIVQELVKLLGGTFVLSSKEREGTEVVVILPKSCPRPNLVEKQAA